MTGPSEHLSWAELACRDAAHTPYPSEWRVTRAVPLAREFEAVRAVLGNKPIRVGSAYRTTEHNRAVGGAKASQHVQGRALDLYPPTGMPVRELHDAVVLVAKRTDSLIRGVGLYPTFVHMDIRPSAVVIHWSTGAPETGEE